MKIRAITLEAFKKFDQAVAVEGFGDGLNLIVGPNEAGKSTLLLGLRTALFERYSSRTRSIKALSPHHVSGAAPAVTLEFEVDDKRYVLEKRFLKKSMARLKALGGRRFEGMEAETELKRLLHLDTSERTSADKGSPAHFGVMLTPQTRSFRQHAVAEPTRHSLEAAIASDIAELGSQSEVDALLADVSAEMTTFVTARGRPRGRYKDVDTQLRNITIDIDNLRQKRDELARDAEALEQATVRRDELMSADDADQFAARLSALEASRAQATRRQALENRRLAARQQIHQLRAKRQELQSRLEEQRRLVDEIADIERAAMEADRTGATIEQKLAEGKSALTDLGERLDELAERKGDLETLARQIERRGDIEGTLSALATEVRFDLNSGTEDSLTINGETPTATRFSVQVTEGLTVGIGDIGQIKVAPKTEPVRQALEAKKETEAAIEALTQRLDLGDAELDSMRSAWRAAATEIRELETARSKLQTALSATSGHAAEAKVRSEALHERQERRAARLAEIMATDGGKTTDPAAPIAALDAEITEAQDVLQAANQKLDIASAEADPEAAPPLPLDQLDAEIDRLRALIDQNRQNVETAKEKVVRLESAIAARAGFGLDEQIDQLERRRHLLTKERDAFALDHRTLALLQTTLQEAADEAKATFNAPLSARLAPYIQDLFPEATPLVTPAFSIRAIDRNGREEPFEHLSAGTREQIAILARLAFADMLQEQGLPALVILDDALAFSDDRRLGRMFEILKKTAERMQVIILTCREERFAEVEATRLHITAPALEHTSSAA